MSSLNNPNQVILVTSRYKEKDNIIALTWHIKTSFQPNLFLISVAKERFSYNLIKKSKCYVVNFMPYELSKEIIFCGNKSGKNLDKFKETKLEKEEAQTINCPIIKQALAYLECKVIKEVETGDHILFIGEVLHQEFKKLGKRPFQLEGNKFTTTLD